MSTQIIGAVVSIALLMIALVTLPIAYSAIGDLIIAIESSANTYTGVSAILRILPIVIVTGLFSAAGLFIVGAARSRGTA